MCSEGDFVLLESSWLLVLSVAPFLSELGWWEKSNQNLRNQENLLGEFSLVTLRGCQTPDRNFA